MATHLNKTDGQLLVLPWNRFNNYWIGGVALINLVGGIAALRIASGFARDATSFDHAAAAVFVGLFGFLFIWVAWCFRTGVLPVRFVADASRRECGFRWARWWNGRFDLTNTEKLIGELRPSGHDRWHWAILLPATSPDEKDRWIYGSNQPLPSAQSAEQECRRALAQLAEHFSLPSEMRPAAKR